MNSKDAAHKNRRIHMLGKWKIKRPAKTAQADRSKALSAEEERLADPRRRKRGLAADLEAKRYVVANAALSASSKSRSILVAVEKISSSGGDS